MAKIVTTETGLRQLVSKSREILSEEKQILSEEKQILSEQNRRISSLISSLKSKRIFDDNLADDPRVIDDRLVVSFAGSPVTVIDSVINASIASGSGRYRVLKEARRYVATAYRQRFVSSREYMLQNPLGQVAR